MKLRRLRRNRRLTLFTYWAPWLVGAVLFLLLLAGGIVSLSAS